MTAPVLWAVVPVKPFDLAKRRLASVLTDHERSELAALMLEDVLETLSACDDLSGILVVTRDPLAIAAAQRHGAATISDETTEGINAAIEIAIGYLADQNNAAMIVVPSDIPHLPPAIIHDIAMQLTAAPKVVAVPATRDGGTNLLAYRPPDVIAPGFGPDSFQRHSQSARDAQITLGVLTQRETGQDIDTPADLMDFLAFRSATRTHAYLIALDIAERMQRASTVGAPFGPVEA